MRKIEFRGKGFYDNVECKDEDCKQWIFGCYCIGPGPTYFIQTIEDITTYKVNPETVGQYTGLKGKNGVKIFEGDILRVTDISANKFFGNGVVYFEDGNFGIQYRETDNHGNGIELLSGLTYAPYDTQVEVIGNIHDNPELLEANND